MRFFHPIFFVLLELAALAPHAYAAAAKGGPVCNWFRDSGCGKGPGWQVAAFNQTTTTAADCDAARADPFYKKNGCYDGDGDNDTGASPFGSCDSSTDCFGMGSLLQGMGLGQMDQLLGEMSKEADRLHALKAKRLDSAASTLDRWAKNLGGTESQRSGDITGLTHDRDLVSKAIDSLDGKTKLDPEAKASNPGVAADLGIVSDITKGENALRQEMEKVEKGRQTLLGMRDNTNGRKNNLGSDLTGTGGKKLAAGGKGIGLDRPEFLDPSKGDSSNGASGISGSSNKDLASGAGAGIGSGLSGRSNKGLETGTGSAGMGANGKGGEKPGDALRKRLAEALTNSKDKASMADKDAEAMQGEAFQKNLLSGGLGSDHKDGSDPKPALEEFIRGEGKKEFTLAGSETDREVKRMIASTDSVADALRSDGVLASDSPDLFQRVKRAYRKIVSDTFW